MRRILLFLAIVLVLGGVGFAASSGGATNAEAVVKQASAAPDLSPAWEAPAAPQTAECTAKAVLFEDPFSSLEASSVSASNCCLDRCRRDRDCDGVCGAKGAGSCVMVNSCCKECACAF